MVFNFLFCFYLTLSLREKMEITNFEIPPTLLTINIKNQEKTSVKSINLDITRKFIECSLNKIAIQAIFSLLFSKYCCSKPGWFYDLHSGSQKTKGLEFHLKAKRKFHFYWHYQNSCCLTSLYGFNEYQFCFILLTLLISKKLKT